MSMLKLPLTNLEREGLIKHGLSVDSHSQMADSFRLGIKHAENRIDKLEETIKSVLDGDLLDKFGNRDDNGLKGAMRDIDRAIKILNGALKADNA